MSSKDRENTKLLFKTLDAAFATIAENYDTIKSGNCNKEELKNMFDNKNEDNKETTLIPSNKLLYALEMYNLHIKEVMRYDLDAPNNDMRFIVNYKGKCCILCLYTTSYNFDLLERLFKSNFKETIKYSDIKYKHFELYSENDLIHSLYCDDPNEVIQFNKTFLGTKGCQAIKDVIGYARDFTD